MHKTYFVEVEGELKDAEIARLLKGFEVMASCCARGDFPIARAGSRHGTASGSQRRKETTNSQDDGIRWAPREAPRAARGRQSSWGIWQYHNGGILLMRKWTNSRNYRRQLFVLSTLACAGP